MDLRITTATGRSVGPIDHHGNGIRDPVGSFGSASLAYPRGGHSLELMRAQAVRTVGLGRGRHPDEC
jgi:hypothetical protein